MREKVYRRGVRGLVGIVVLTMGLGAGMTPAFARGATSWTYYCGSYQSWTDSYSGDVVHDAACVRVANTGDVTAASRSYVTNYNLNRPIDPWHTVIQLYDKTGTWRETHSCDDHSAPVGSSNYFVCYGNSYSITANGSTVRADVCLFYLSGQTNCAPWTSYTKA